MAASAPTSRPPAESHEAVGDRINDAIRVDGKDLRCRVVGEGGNLGFTQRGRIEYALAGGRINTDFIDNSGGVHCSDREVNLKILLGMAEERGDLDRAGRDELVARWPTTSSQPSSTTTSSRPRSSPRKSRHRPVVSKPTKT